MKRIFLNETGQMTVFVALIFQVLFVFFAMVINIGLLVHDKINLQNAVDLGAYYGAQRQAEILNEIAHINYQIRQDNKLLAWRYRVLGTLGRDGGLGYTPGSSPQTQNYSPTDAEFEDPSVCVLNTFWYEATAKSTEAENYCYRKYGAAGTIKSIPRLTVVAPFLPGVILGRILIDNLIDTQRGALSDQGPLNWTFAAQMMVAYKMAIASRKAVVQRLATNLVKEDPPDQGNQSTRQGVFQTIRKNLTVSNLATFSEDNFDFKNGLATSACAGTNNDGSPTIVEVRTSPLLLYTYSTNATDYTINQAFLSDIRFDPSTFPNQTQFRFLTAFTSGEPSTKFDNSTENGLQASSLGFEKNPWCMAYIAVSAKTTPRKPFAPFGQAVELVARSFAQPFGGRIGPWYKSLWPQSSDISTGARVDPLSTPRMYNDASDGNGDYKALLPNYSRYPGDQLGIRSLAHQAGARQFIRGYKGKGNSQLTYDYFTNFDRIPITGDPLAFDNTTGAPQDKIAPGVKNVRTAEEIAIAPDLFDATYYSIDLNYSSNYKQLNGNGARFGSLGNPFGLQRVVAPDLGGRNGTDFEGFNVQKQIEVANSGLDQMLRNTLGYYLADPAHVLTSWAPNTNSNFSFPIERFAKCSAYASKAQYMIPGVCTNGGRVGYSVRIISRDHLLSDKWEIGGEGQVGPIKNPPPIDF